MAEVVPLVPAWRVDKSFSYRIPEKLSGSIEVGSLVRIPFGNRKVRGVVVRIGAGDAEGLEEVLRTSFPAPVAPEPMPQVLEWVAARYTTPRGIVYDRVVPPRVKVRATFAEVVPGVPGGLLGNYSGGPDLLRAIAAGEAGTWCLQALPTHDRGALLGEIVSAAVTHGSALVTVPEVHYGSLVTRTLMEAFPGAVRIDSSAGDQERSAGWAALGAGARVGLGGRGAVLAPARNLRAIVVDEEAHIGYKEDRSPRFDARRVAVMRAGASQAVCVLVANAPSIETGWAAREGTFGWVRPSREALKGARPNVELTEPSESGTSQHLHRAIADTLRAGGRVGLLVPRAGYSRSLWCAVCRRSVRCPRCEAGVIYDRAERSVRCPRCGWSGAAPSVCPSCRAADFRMLGAGSERLEEQLARTYPRARVRRVDRGVLERAPGAPDVGDVDIYVTTWIGTKPELRPPVSLVGVLDADALIRRPDFRAVENAYVALAEMSEWAGPASDGGRLVVQTAEPGHHAIQAVVRADFGHFVEREAEARRELGYPPFSELVKLRAGGSEAGALLRRAAGVAREHGATALGPIPVRTDRGPASELLLKCPDAGEVASDLRVILPEVPRGSYLRVDVDPR